MEPPDELEKEELERAFSDTSDPNADAEIAALNAQGTTRKLITFILLILAILGAGVGVGWAIYHSTHGP